MDEEQRVATPWPEWMLRFIASDDEAAYEDLIWSVGGSPPYGGVSYEEAAAVYELLESYTGPGLADESLYDEVVDFIKKDPCKMAVLAIFRANDDITSSPDSFTLEPVRRMETLNEQIGHEGIRALCKAYTAQLAYQGGDMQQALTANREALIAYLELADKDEAYAMRAAQTAQNMISFTALSGDEETARQLQQDLAPILKGYDPN